MKKCMLKKIALTLVLLMALMIVKTDTAKADGFQSCSSCGQYTYFYTKCTGEYNPNTSRYAPVYVKSHGSCSYIEMWRYHGLTCASCDYTISLSGTHPCQEYDHDCGPTKYICRYGRTEE